MFIAAARPLTTALQRSAMCSCHDNIRLPWSRNSFWVRGYKHLVPPGPKPMFDQHIITHYQRRRSLWLLYVCGMIPPLN